MRFNSVGFLAIAASLLCLASGDSAASSTRNLIRGGSSIHHDQQVTKDLHLLEDEDDVDEERELGRVKARKNGGSDSGSDGSSSKGSKSSKSGSSSSKGSKGSKSGSKGSKGGGGGGRRRRRSGPSCGAGCGDKDFAYIYLEGSYFFRDFNDDSVDVVPIEGTGRLNNTKDGSTIRILDQDLKGYAKYFDHGDYRPVKNDIHGSVSGSCTLLATYEGETTQVDSELCLAHCTICVAYEGQCCESSNPYEGEWGEPWGKESCETYRGYATITADLLFALEFFNGTGSSLISIPDGGLVSLDGLGPITGAALELSGASNGGVGYIEYDALDRNEGDVYKIGLQVPFNDRASCKLQDEFHGFDVPPPDTPRPPPPTRPPTDLPALREVPIGDSFQITQDVTAGATCGTEGGLDQSKVEVCLLSDASSSFADDLPNLVAASEAIFNEVSNATDEAKFGVAAFIDYPVSGFGAPGDYPYMLLSSMSSSFTDWNDGINNIVIGSGGDFPESQYDGIVGGTRGLNNSFVSEPNCGWTNDPTVQKIMVVSTDATFHTPSPGVHENDLASTTAILQEEQIRLIGLKAPGAGSELDSLAAATGGSAQSLSSDGSDIAEAILGGLEDLPCLITPIAMGCEPLEVAFEPPNQMVPPGGSAMFTGVFTVPNVEELIGSTVTCDVLFSANGDIVETIQISVLITPSF